MRRAGSWLIFGMVCLAAAMISAEQVRPETEGGCDYRNRTIYFLMTDRFHAHEPYDPYVDPKNPSATNEVNCFVQSCTEEQQFRSYWGGDPGSYSEAWLFA